MTYTSGDPEVFQKGGWEGEGWLGEIEDGKIGGANFSNIHFCL